MSGPDRRRLRSAGAPLWLYAPEGHLRTPWRLLLLIGAIVLGQGIAQAILAPVFTLISRSVGETVPVYPWAMLGGVMIAVVIALRQVDDEPWSSIAMGEVDWSATRLFAGMLLGSAAIGTTTLLLAVFGFLHAQYLGAVPIEGGTTPLWMQWSWTAFFLLLVLAPAALWEEVLFRGYLWKIAEDAGGRTIALWSTSIAFGVVHLTNLGAGARTTLLVLLAGLCLGVVRMRIGLPGAWLAHLAWNWVMAALLHMPVSGIEFAQPGYRVLVSGPEWFTGGEWGPEGGAAAALVLLVALFVAERRRSIAWYSNWTRTRRTPGEPDSLAGAKGS